MSDEAHEGWRLFAAAHGVTVSGLVNAIGEDLADLDDRRLPALIRRAVARGREIDAERRQRPSR